MARPFLTAEWRYLLMANYEIDPSVLKPHLPCQTELDEFEGRHYISLVGFLFRDTRLGGMPIPFHRNFEEVNLRFYVKYKDGNQWKRGVVFIKELVPKRMITLVANTVYGEKYATHRMRHSWNFSEEEMDIGYYWKVKGEWNHIRAKADPKAIPPVRGSKEEFITEHYWGYTFISDSCTGQYEVAHPSWKVHAVKSYDIHCHAGELYGKEFEAAFQQSPKSVFLAEGSPISVMKGSRLFRRI